MSFCFKQLELISTTASNRLCRSRQVLGHTRVEPLFGTFCYLGKCRSIPNSPPARATSLRASSPMAQSRSPSVRMVWFTTIMLCTAFAPCNPMTCEQGFGEKRGRKSRGKPRKRSIMTSTLHLRISTMRQLAKFCAASHTKMSHRIGQMQIKRPPRTLLLSSKVRSVVLDCTPWQMCTSNRK